MKPASAREKGKRMKRNRLPSFARLRRKLDVLFSRFIHARDAGKRCISCGSNGQLQAGHFIKRQHLATRWEPMNVHLQCVRCNHWLHGNEGAYALALVDLYGEAVVRNLLVLKHSTVKFTRADLQELIERYSK